MSELLHGQLTARALRRVGASLCGRYRVERLIGMGGMAAVYAGRHRNGHVVAIKILHERLSLDAEIERLFRREALLANKIQHPGVVPVIDDDVTDDGCAFLAMPLLVGETLRATSARLSTQFPIEDAVTLTAKVLDILAAAHAAKIVHRDIKPENVFLTLAGDVRILDFGIARFFETNDPASATRSGRAVGTPAFMAPEQALGRLREIDGRTDVWASGALLFSLISGRTVHDGESGSEVLVRAATCSAPLLADLAPHAPAPICAVVDRALAFEREARWPSATEMAVALRAAFAEAFGRTPDEQVNIRPAVAVSADVHAATTHPPNVEPPSRTEGGVASAVRQPTTPGLRERVTRTMTLLAPQTRRSRGLIALTLAITGGLAIAWKLGKPPQSAQPEQHAAAMSPAAAPWSKGAIDSYQAGLQLTREGSLPEARAMFTKVVDQEPTFAAAHLRLVMLSGFIRTSTREHYAKAQQYRATLSPLDAALLEAFAPAVADHPDWKATIASLEALSAKYPADGEIAFQIARHKDLTSDASGTIDAANAAMKADPQSAAPLLSLGNAYVQLDRLDEARSAFNHCLELAPASTGCFQLLLQLESNEGNCDAAEKLSRQLIARVPDSPTGYEFLAGALFEKTQSVSSARAAVEQRWARLSAENRKFYEWHDQFSLSVLEGDFDSARHWLDTWQSAIEGEPGAAEQGDLAMLKMRLPLVLGERETAVALAQKYLVLSKAWASDEFYDFRMPTLRLLYTAGGMSRADFVKEREAWLKDPGEALSFAGVPSFQWVEAFAGIVRTHDDVADAIANLPKERPFFMATYRDADMDEVAGATFLAAGDLVQARRLLTKVTHSCTISEPIGQTRSFLDMGDVLHAEHDDKAACDSYRVVWNRWGRERKSVDARTARERLESLHCSIR